MKFAAVALVTVALTVACSRTGSKSAVTFSLTQKALNTAQGASQFNRIMINVTGPGIDPPIVRVWQSRNSTDVAPASFTIDVPRGNSRLVQALVIANGTTASELTTPYNCGGGDDNHGGQFLYADATLDIGNPATVDLGVSDLAITPGAEGSVSGRYLPTAGVNAGPTGKLIMKALIPGRRAMIVDTSEVFDGWFHSYAMEGVTFQYLIGGQDILGQGFDLANAGTYLDSQGIPPTRAYVVQTAAGWSPQGGPPSFCGGRKMSAQKVLYGTFGPGAGQMTACAPVTSQVEVYQSYAYTPFRIDLPTAGSSSGSFTFSGQSYWMTNGSGNDAHVLYPSGGSGVVSVGDGVCASGSDLVDRLVFDPSAAGGNHGGGSQLAPVLGPFSTLPPTAGLYISPITGGFNLMWTYLPNMDGILSGAAVFVRTGVYASGNAISPDGNADFRADGDVYQCSNLTALGFKQAGFVGKDAANHLLSSFAVTGLTATDIASGKVQIVICPKLASDGSLSGSALACGDHGPCGAGK
jgi:hypothetical protein